MRGGSTSGRGPISSRIRRSGSARRAPMAPRRSALAAMIQATFLTGYANTAPVFEGYRRGWREAGRGQNVPIDRLAYAAFVYYRRQRSEGSRRRRRTPLAHRHQQSLGAFRQSARLHPSQAMARGGRTGLSRFPKAPTVDAAVEQGIMFAGTPDQVLKQFDKFYDHVGGFGHLLVAGQSGFSPTRRPCTASRCWRARCSRGCGSATRTRPYPACSARRCRRDTDPQSYAVG